MNDTVGGERLLALIVEDSPDSLDIMRRALEAANFRTLSTDRESGCLEIVNREPVSIVLLDWWLTEGDGLGALRQVRAVSKVPIIMVSGRAQPTDRAMALELGADDYINKPFTNDELVARVRAVLRRQVAPREMTKRILALDAHGLRMDIETREVIVRGLNVALTPKEFRLLQYLVERAGSVVQREDLRKLLFQSDDPKHDAAIDTHVSRLRRKIEEDADHPKLFVTVYGVGYRITMRPEEMKPREELT